MAPLILNLGNASFPSLPVSYFERFCHLYILCIRQRSVE